MWDMLVRTPRGRISTRKYLSVAIVFITVCFAYIFATAPTTHAADAAWKGSDITYQHHTYKKDAKPATGSETHGLPKGTVIYRYVESAGSGSGGATQKAYLIYFAPGTDPATAATATYHTYDLLGQTGYSNPSLPIDITLEPLSTATPEDGGADNPGTTSCAVEGIGWIVCPVTNFLAKGMDLIYGWVSGFLKVPPLATSQDQALYRAWGYMRTFANIAFIAAFLMVIYSQITNVGLSNYDIKKMLPRLVIAAILVNTSYWVCAVAVDAFNILGYSVQDLFIMIRNSLVGEEGNSWEVISWESMSAVILSGGSVAVAGGIGAYLGIAAIGSVAGLSGLIFLLLPLLLSVLFVVLMTFLILAARQAIITILIIIAPLAFVAFLLPNTEKWFEKWRSTFFTLLLVFPAFSLVFGGAQLAAAAIIQNAKGADALNVILLGMAVQVAPLAITPLLLKLGGGVLNRFAGIVNNPTKGMFDRGKNWSKERLEANQAHKMKRMSRDPNSIRRFGPSRVAFNRDQNRRRREGWKSANEAHTAGEFSKTASGINIYKANERAKLEKGLGDSQGHQAWNRQVYTDRVLRAKQHAQIAAQHTGDIYHEEVENTGKEAFEHALHANAGLTRVKIDAVTAGGRAKVYEEGLDAAANLELQTQIARNVGGLGNLKTNTAVNAGLAENKKKLVDAQGALALKQTVEGSRALSHEVQMATRFEKQAAEYDTIVQKAAEAAYDDYSRTNTGAQELRLRSTAASDRAALTESQVTRMIEDAREKGYGSREVASSNTLLAYELQAIADSQMGEKKAIEAIQAAAQSRSEKRFATSADGRQLNTSAQAAKDSLEAAKAEEAALVQERRTEAGAEGLTGEDKRIADELRDADIQKRAQTQRTTAATGTANTEYAGLVKNDATIPGGTETVATVAGGIAGEAGISQAKATATQVIFEAFDKAVSAEKTLVSRNKPDEILSEEIADPSDPSKKSKGLGHADILSEPEERIAALAGKISSGSHHQSKIKLWERMGELGRQAQSALTQAEASGDPVAIAEAKERVGKVKSLEQQVFGDKNKVPFGVGEVDMGQAEVGKYDGDIYHSTRKRIHSHMSAQTLANMDQDDLRLVFEMARAGQLSSTELSKLNKSYNEWEKDDNLKASLQPKHRQLLDPIRQEAENGTRTYPQPDGGFWDDRYDPIRSMSPPQDDPRNY